MTGLFGSLNTATGGMRTQQIALQTTSHNLANTNTVGYSRQRVTTEANAPQSYAGIGQIGTGVLIKGITRITDDFITMQIQNERASLAYYEEKSEVLSQVESVFNEPSTTGISNQMSKLFISWGNLATNPESTTPKSMVIHQAETFLDTVNHTTNQLTDLAADTLTTIDKEVLDFNSVAVQLKSVNDQIFNATLKGEQPNDLMDRRDVLVGTMVEIAGVKVDKDEYGRASITLDGQEIINKNGVKPLHLIKATNKTSITFMVGDQTVDNSSAVSGSEVKLTTGRAKGLEEAYGIVTDKKADVDTFMDNLVTSVNKIYGTVDAKESDNPSEITKSFFVKEDGQYRVKSDLLDYPENLITGYSNATGDGSRAQEIAKLQNATENNILDQYNKIVTDLGITKQQSDNMVANQQDLTALLEQRQASVSGVDINEEVINMIQQQTAFQANARVISTISEMLDTLINRTGV